METKEIRQDVREYIVNEVNTTLARLGVSENLEPNEERGIYYNYQTKPIRQYPMMFSSVVVEASISHLQVIPAVYKGWTEDYDIVCVSLSYRYDTFGGGHNGTEIGNIYFAVGKDMRENIKHMDMYIHKVKGLEI